VPDEAQSVDELYRIADSRLYEAKDASRVASAAKPEKVEKVDSPRRRAHGKDPEDACL